MRRLALPLLLLVAWGVPLRAQTFVRGDADSNGRIELTDGIRILEFLFVAGPPPTPMTTAGCASPMPSASSSGSSAAARPWRTRVPARTSRCMNSLTAAWTRRMTV